VLYFFLACARTPDSVILDFDASRDGVDGADGQYGVMLHPAFGGDDPPADLLYPIDEDRQRVSIASGGQNVILLQGGSVTPERYHWLGTHMASRGASVLVPHHGLDLPWLDSRAGTRALAWMQESGDVQAQATAIVGHSLGGVVGAMQWLDERQAGSAVTGLALLAAWPDEGTNVALAGEGSVLGVVGSADTKGTVDEVRTGLGKFSAETGLAIVEGMNHYDWTDDATAGELGSDGAASRGQDETRRDAQRVLDAWLDACVGERDALAWSRFELGAPSTVTLEGGPCPAEESAE
jgi:hypothetical protein